MLMSKNNALKHPDKSDVLLMLRGLTGKLGRHQDIIFCERLDISTILISCFFLQEARLVLHRGVRQLGLRLVHLSIGMLTE